MARPSSKILTPAQKKERTNELKDELKSKKAEGKGIIAERKEQEKALKEIVKREAANSKEIAKLTDEINSLKAA